MRLCRGALQVSCKVGLVCTGSGPLGLWVSAGILVEGLLVQVGTKWVISGRWANGARLRQ